MPYPTLGCLERVDLETRWNGEPSGFAPWFLDPDRLRILGDAPGLWRIGDSRPALRFDVAAAPYRWPGPGPLSQAGSRRGRYPCRVIGG